MSERKRPLRVAVVDDEEHLALMFRNALLEDGCLCDAFFRPRKALSSISAKDYDVLVTDLKMPGIDGIDLMEAAKAIRPNIKVIFVTGDNGLMSAGEAVKVGADEFLAKPFDLTKLCETVRRVASGGTRRRSGSGDRKTDTGSGPLRSDERSDSFQEPDTFFCPDIPGYRIIKRIGTGAMGSVFRAEQTNLDRLVAIKVIRPSAFESMTSPRRFTREARAAAKMNHPNIVQVYDLVEREGFLFFVMEYFPSRQLDDIVTRSGRLPLRKALRITLHMAAALQHANAHDIVHRDVKPSNILIGKGWRAKLTDFGLAKKQVVEGGAESQGGITRVGGIIGTPAYISPEQAAALPAIDFRSDIYGLGLCVFFMLEGHDPFSGELAELLAAQIAEPLPDITAPGVPEALKRLLRKMTAKRRDDRISEFGSLIADLRGLLTANAEGEGR